MLVTNRNIEPYLGLDLFLISFSFVHIMLESTKPSIFKVLLLFEFVLIMVKVLDLKECLKSQAPELSQRVINNLANLVDYYQLPWFSDREGKGVYFLFNDVAKMRGINTRSILRAWKRFQQNNKIINAPIPPASYRLKREGIEELKKREPKLKIGKCCPQLSVCNWTLVYAWMITPEFPLPNVIRSNKRVPEKVIQSQLIGISTYSPNPLRREMTIEDVLPNPVNTRRFDLVRKIGKEIHIYELKSRVLENEDVASTIGAKGYLELAMSHFNSKIKFHFVAEGITSEASRLLRAIGNVGFVTIKDMAENLKQEILEVTPESGRWFYEKEIFPAYPILK